MLPNYIENSYQNMIKILLSKIKKRREKIVALMLQFFGLFRIKTKFVFKLQ